MADTFRCTASFAYPVGKDGEMLVCAAGALVASDSAAYKAAPAQFETAEVAAGRQEDRRSVKAEVVEQATAAPGEKRTRGGK